ncbi:MAG: 30S ribosomal protein THX [Flavobacteriales bacterium]|nr:30S ribosomal protein THX [Flavobacteriales bacterium]
MGKGDIKSKRGKITAGTYGVTRKRKASSGFAAIPKTKKQVKETSESPKKEPAKKTTTKKTTVAKKATAKKNSR